MDLRDYAFQYTYGPHDDRLNTFYVPALSRSVRYDRFAGYFSSSALSVAAAGVARLIGNQGRMRLLVGAQLAESDVEALLGGAQLADLVAQRMNQGLEQRTDAITRERLAALAWMIRHGTLEVRVVLPTGPDGRPLAASQSHGYFHAKTGVFSDTQANQVAFTGSINEGEQAWLHNYEMFSVYCSWKTDQQAYIDTYQSLFERLWQNQEPGWLGLPVPAAVTKRLLRLCPNSAPSRDPLEKPEPPA